MRAAAALRVRVRSAHHVLHHPPCLPTTHKQYQYDDKSQLNFANALGSAFTPFTFNAPTYVTSTCKQAQAVAEYTATFFPPSASYCTSKDIPSETLFMSQLGPAMPPSSPPPPPASPTVS